MGSRMELTDEAAVALTKDGDADAFRVLVERHSTTVFRLAYRMTGNEQDAEDIVQESFLRAFRQLHTLDGRASFRTWLYRIVTNCALDALRKSGRRPQPFRPGGDEGEDPVLAVPSGDPTPERIAMSAEVRHRLEAAMSLLSASERSAFVMRHFEGMHIEQVSEVLGCGQVAARHAIFRAVQKLRRALEPLASGVR
jgi:RNA polymerase sigma-70 factor, ECF subfamily